MSSRSIPLEEELVIDINPEDMFFEDEVEKMETETYKNNINGSEADISKADDHYSIFFSDEDSNAVAPGLLDRSFASDSMPDLTPVFPRGDQHPRLRADRRGVRRAANSPQMTNPFFWPGW